MGPKSKDRLWKLRWWIRRWWGSEGERWNEQRRHFYRMTGMHPAYAARGPATDLEIIAMQARKIKGLEQFIADQRKGYQRKIARLERKLADPQPSQGEVTP